MINNKIEPIPGICSKTTICGDICLNLCLGNIDNPYLKIDNPSYETYLECKNECENDKLHHRFCLLFHKDDDGILLKLTQCGCIVHRLCFIAHAQDIIIANKKPLLCPYCGSNMKNKKNLPELEFCRQLAIKSLITEKEKIITEHFEYLDNQHYCVTKKTDIADKYEIEKVKQYKENGGNCKALCMFHRLYFIDNKETKI